MGWALAAPQRQPQAWASFSRLAVRDLQADVMGVFGPVGKYSLLASCSPLTNSNVACPRGHAF